MELPPVPVPVHYHVVWPFHAEVSELSHPAGRKCQNAASTLQACQMSIHGAPADHKPNGLASWLIYNGFQDRNAAELASRSLDIPCLNPLWSVLQRKMRMTAGRANPLAYKAETTSDPCDPQLVQAQKLKKLTEQVQDVIQQLVLAQVCNHRTTAMYW